MSDAVYTRLLALRTGLRHFERWSESQARLAGLTPAQHQLLLAVRGHNDPRGPTVGELADYLLLRHHSVVGLIDRADAAGLVTRIRDEDDHRIVRLHLTKDAAARLEALSALHLEELERLAPQLPGAGEGLAPTQRTHGFPGSPSSPATQPEPLKVTIARVYDVSADYPGRGILVDRLWPRGLSRTEGPVETWPKDVAPSAALRKWYGNEAERFDEFARRYRYELTTAPAARKALGELREHATARETVLLTAAKDLEHSAAAVLQEVLAGG